jgi:quinol monooxygenase YgiN
MGAGAATWLGGTLAGASTPAPALIRWAELDVLPDQLSAFHEAALALHDAVVRHEPGVQVYDAAAEMDRPGHIHSLEVYDNANVYDRHARQPHFQAFRAATDSLVTARRMHDASPVKLGAKALPGTSPLVRLTELRIVPALLPAYRAAVTEEIEISIRIEPGVLGIHAVSLVDAPAQLRFFEIYADEAAYRMHIASPHFRQYVEATRAMIQRAPLDGSPRALSQPASGLNSAPPHQ